MKFFSHVIDGLPLLLGVTLLMSSCGTSYMPPVATQPSAPKSFWRPDTATGARKIVIDLSRQEARYYKGETLVGLSPIASGSSAHPTPTGSYKVTEKDIDHRSSCYGAYVDPRTSRIIVEDVDNREDPRPPGTVYKGAKMHYFMRFNGGIGMHEGYLPGYPASHGCVRMPTRMARLFFNETPHGTPVVVTGNADLAGRHAPVPVGEATPGSTPSDRASALRAGGYSPHPLKPAPPQRGQTIYLY